MIDINKSLIDNENIISSYKSHIDYFFYSAGKNNATVLCSQSTHVAINSNDYSDVVI